MADGEIFAKKEVYDAKKQGKRKLEKRRNLSQWFKKAGVLLIVFVVVAFVAGDILIVAFENRQSAPAGVNIEDYILRYPIQGREHIEVATAHPEYNSNPPTSGWHYEEEARWGIFEKELSDEQLVHNLEHCGVWISYHPSIPSSTKAALVAFANGFSSKIIMTPRVENDAPIVLASWGILMKLPDFDYTKMEAFVVAFLNKNGPECQAQ